MQIVGINLWEKGPGAAGPCPLFQTLSPFSWFSVFGFRFSVEIMKIAFTENRKQKTENLPRVGRGV
jgi:hypothetical protein